MKTNRTTDPMQTGSTAPVLSQNLSAAAFDTCGAKTRSGAPCRNLPMKNGRCRMHGGASTGPKTAAGLARSRSAGLIHGGRSREMRELRELIRSLRVHTRRLIELA